MPVWRTPRTCVRLNPASVAWRTPSCLLMDLIYLNPARVPSRYPDCCTCCTLTSSPHCPGRVSRWCSALSTAASWSAGTRSRAVRSTLHPIPEIPVPLPQTPPLILSREHQTIIHKPQFLSYHPESQVSGKSIDELLALTVDECWQLCAIAKFHEKAAKVTKTAASCLSSSGTAAGPASSNAPASPSNAAFAPDSGADVPGESLFPEADVDLEVHTPQPEPESSTPTPPSTPKPLINSKPTKRSIVYSHQPNSETLNPANRSNSPSLPPCPRCRRGGSPGPRAPSSTAGPPPTSSSASARRGIPQHPLFHSYNSPGPLRK